MSKGLTNGCSGSADSGVITGVVTPTTRVERIMLPTLYNTSQIQSVVITIQGDGMSSGIGVARVLESSVGYSLISSESRIAWGSTCAGSTTTYYTGNYAEITDSPDNDGIVYEAGYVRAVGSSALLGCSFEIKPYYYTITPSAVYS